MSLSLRLVLPVIAGAALALLGGCAATHHAVLVNGWSAQGKEAPRYGGQWVPKSFFVIYGKDDATELPDDSFLAVPQAEVTRIIGRSMIDSGLVPAQEIREADLALLVFRGMTGVDLEEVTIPDGNLEDGDDTLTVEQATTESLVRNANKLGLTDIFGRGFIRSEAEFQRAKAEEERYYFVVVALDARELWQRRRKVEWITRFSVEARGRTYAEALTVLADGARGYYGRSTEGQPVTSRVEIGGKVEVGEAEVIGIGPQTPVPEPRRAP